jgi:Tfp pilus assembly protein PilE
MIVVAIIGILAAIAIPQFAQYRIKAFNSAAASDAKTMVTTMEASYTDAFSYPIQAGGTLIGPGGTGQIGSQTVNLSKGVVLAIEGLAQAYSLMTKHDGGDRCFHANQFVSTVVENTTNATTGATLTTNAEGTPSTTAEPGDETCN